MKLIDKDALLAKIDGEIKLLEPYLGACAGQIVAEANSKNAAYNRVNDIINVLEVKEVDLEKSISDWLFEGLPNEDELIDYIKETAKHFFELGLKTQKGEEL